MKNLKKLRQQHHLSQQDLADVLHISQQSINKYEKYEINPCTPDIGTLIKMADYFNTSIDYIVGLSDIPEKAEPRTETALNTGESYLIELYRQLSPSQKDCVINLILELLKK